MDEATIVVTVLVVRTKPDNPRLPLGRVGGDSNRYFFLPDADYQKTVEALTAAGFKSGDRLLDSLSWPRGPQDSDG